MARRKKGPSPRGRGRSASVRRKRKSRFREQAKCRFCRQKVDEVDYKDVSTLVKLTTQQGKIFSRKRSGNCARHQRSCMRAIKRARLLALLPYVS
jgi:small subunit ribosomal protein S18